MLAMSWGHGQNAGPRVAGEAEAGTCTGERNQVIQKSYRMALSKRG